MVGLAGEVVISAVTCSLAISQHFSRHGLFVIISVGGVIIGFPEVVALLLVVCSVGTSGLCKSSIFLGGMLGFRMVSVFRSNANWMLISSICLRRIHIFLSVSADLLSVVISMGEFVAFVLMLLSVAGPVGTISNLHHVVARGAVSGCLVHCWSVE